jgi:hypothetical protein
MDIYRLGLNHSQLEFPNNSSDATAAGRFNFGQGPTQASTVNAAGQTVTTAGSQYNSMAAFLLGYVTGGGRLLLNGDAKNGDEYTTRTGMYSFYVRDQWQATRNLTINIGTRYEYFPLPTRSNRGMERYNFDTNQMLVCGVGDIPKNCGTKVGNLYFSPRIGVAYRANERTVFRSGFGINWDPWNLARPLRTNYPVLAAGALIPPTSLGWARRLSEGLPNFAAPEIGNGVLAIPPNYALNTTDDKYTRGYVLNWNATIERQIGGNFTAQAAYVASRAVHTAGVLDLNAGQIPGADNAGRPFFQRFGRTAADEPRGCARIFHVSLAANAVESPLLEWLPTRSSYTWSKTIGLCCDEENNGGPRIKAVNFMHLNKALLSSDRTHNFQLTAIYELPFGVGRRWNPGNGLARAVVSGWQINTLTSIFSGSPFSVTSDGGSLRMPGNDQRADQVKAEVKKLGGIGVGQPYYDWTAFARVTEARFGTAGWNNLRGPGVFSSDLGLFRKFAMSERTNLEFRAEAFNWTNTPKFSNPSGGINNLQLNPDGSFRTACFEVTGHELVRPRRSRADHSLGMRLSFSLRRSGGRLSSQEESRPFLFEFEAHDHHGSGYTNRARGPSSGTM